MRQILPTRAKSKQSSIISKLRFRSASDSGDGNIIAALLILPMAFFLILTGVDMGFYFHNASSVSDSVRDGARTTAVYGHPGTLSRPSVIERQHGAEWGQDQIQAYNSNRNTESSNGDRIYWAGGSVQNSVEMQIAQQLEYDSLYNVELRNINCTTDRETGTENVRVSCGVEWRYTGMAGSLWSFVNNQQNDGWRETVVSANSDVYLDAERGGVLAAQRVQSSVPNGYRGGTI